MSGVHIQKLLGAPRAGMRVCRRKKSYVVEPDGFIVASADTPIMPISAKEVVVDEDGNVIPPTGRFYVSAATIDPYHIIFDIF